DQDPDPEHGRTESVDGCLEPSSSLHEGRVGRRMGGCQLGALGASTWGEWSMHLRHLLALALGAAALLGVTSLSSAAPAGSFTTVVSGLDNPRDLAFGPNGKLYVAEAGSGGPDCVGGGEAGTLCLGLTGGL